MPLLGERKGFSMTKCFRFFTRNCPTNAIWLDFSTFNQSANGNAASEDHKKRINPKEIVFVAFFPNQVAPVSTLVRLRAVYYGNSPVSHRRRAERDRRQRDCHRRLTFQREKTWAVFLFERDQSCFIMEWKNITFLFLSCVPIYF